MKNKKLYPVSTKGYVYLIWLRKVTLQEINHRVSYTGVHYLKINRLEYHERYSGLLLISAGPPRYLNDICKRK